MYEKAETAAQYILSQTRHRPRVAVVLGSGLGAFADELHEADELPYAEIPEFPRSSVAGHAGKLSAGLCDGAAVWVMSGRVHFYEGFTMEQVVFPLRVLARAGIKALVLTNAAGGINPAYAQGSLVVLSDHINLQGTNPLIGSNDPRFGPRFIDMSGAYDAEYRKLALEQGRALGIEMHEGVYLAVPGPSYETPAEIRAFRTLGADLVGMSTVAETIAARHMGARVLAISCVTNQASGASGLPISHEEVMQVGARVRGQLSGLLQRVVPRLDADLAAA